MDHCDDDDFSGREKARAARAKEAKAAKAVARAVARAAVTRCQGLQMEMVTIRDAEDLDFCGPFLDPPKMGTTISGKREYLWLPGQLFLQPTHAQGLLRLGIRWFFHMFF